MTILSELHRRTGRGTLVFPGERDHERPISDNSVRTALISMGYTPETQTWHGFRATARTMLAERLEFDPLLVEAQLAHAVKDANGRAYNRTSYLQQRAKMMQAWADYLDALRENRDLESYRVDTGPGTNTLTSPILVKEPEVATSHIQPRNSKDQKTGESMAEVIARADWSDTRWR